MSRRALVIVQGINKGLYLKRDIEDVNKPFINRYDEATLINSEKVFDNHKTWAYYIPFIGDSLNDILVYYKQKEARAKVCRKVRNKILKLQSNGYKVDLVCHSLGCQIALCSGPSNTNKPVLKVNKTYLMGSPLGIGFNTWPLALRSKVIKHTEEHGNNFKSDKIIYLYSNEDFVSKRSKKDKRVFTLLQSFSNKPIVTKDLDVDHDAIFYAQFLN